MNKPMVSIEMITYNHEKYIAKAIESVLKQKVNFRYELLIGEDASTDRTAMIVDSYQKKYPDIIKVFHRKRNVGCGMNNRLTLQECEGKYVATLEGDDYWDYDMKLQRQVDYLEEHEEIFATAHNVCTVDKNGNKLDESYVSYIDFPIQKKHIYNKHNAMKLQLIGHLSSYVYRNLKDFLSKEQWKAFWDCRITGDLKLSYTLGMIGKIVFFDDVWSCRRMLFEGDGWTATTYQKNMQYVLFNFDLEACVYLKKAFGADIDVSKNLLLRLKTANGLVKLSPTSENVIVAVKIYMAYINFLIKSVMGKYGYLKEMECKCKFYNQLWTGGKSKIE